ncbi:DMT family transporter [Rhizobiaceae bacterium n13]|uniref:DMT family transporter n=1 Tax=Ferirhizobium litorale TaxID=2927786 RepID=A0AAE3QJL6_9HYPH|nr:DMT family transporter [Fererhizobium litorale]MDI7863850.1 DMT family transporter [Fererhizobium litorale]MDI7924318.1 DMT family transporter [Fererhizobium litorale]
MPISRNTQGALFMSLSMAGFTCNDALVKTLLPVMNVGQIMLVRGALTTIMVYAIARHLGALTHWKRIAQPMVLFRIVFEIIAAITYLTALRSMPLANAAAILQAMPLAVTLGAALFLNEPVGWRRWGAIIVGFIGVLIIIRPDSEGFTLASFYVVIAMLCAAGRDLVTRKITTDVSSLMVTVVTAASIALAGAVVMVPMGGWQPMSWSSCAILLAASVLVLVGYQFVILSMRSGEISFIAPFRYTGMLWAILLGALVFGDLPDAWIIAGSTIVIASGLYSFYRENKRRLRPVAQEPST